ncbi:kelch-like protein diablo [Lingula anatina]|uniref:Kelch-like protein diablo n=1 Tax=Lingula anatina TaxID=7574 RepID=A0A1S3K1I7_LINAN|nr:kelch-like protein diablo [Lingula anatina]|eukprot:XP_013416498.1 kelch-like protein diablo [Lingula anatina]
MAALLLQKLRKKESLSSNDEVQCKVLENHATHILHSLECLWKQESMCDVSLLADTSERILVHRLVLVSSCDYFHDLFSRETMYVDEQVQVRLSGISVSTLKDLVTCMYTGRISINDSNVLDLLTAADYLKFYAVQEACGVYLSDRLNSENCLRMLKMAYTYNLRDLIDKALKIAAENFTDIAITQDFRQLEVSHVKALLAQDGLKVDCELDAFNRALEWIEVDLNERKQHALELLRQIRLPLIDVSDIVDHVETVGYLMEIPGCQELVKEALHYHCLPARQSILQSSRTKPRSNFILESVLAVGGAPRLKTDPVSSQVLFYNSQTDEWRTLTNLKEPRHHHAVAVLSGFLYVAGGEKTNGQETPLNTAHRYDPRTDTWLQIASMKHCRESFQLGVLNGLIYAVGGRVNQKSSLADVERYNPAVDEWEPITPLSTPRRSAAVASLNGRLYAMGGSGDRLISSRVERYNPLTDNWEIRRSLSTPRFFAMLVPWANHLFLVGGATLDPSGNVTCVSCIERYTPVTDTWCTLSSMQEPRAEAGCALLGSKIYVVGGYSWNRGARLSSVEVYDIDKDTWSPAASIHTPYTGISCGALTLYRLPNKSHE